MEEKTIAKGELKKSTVFCVLLPVLGIIIYIVDALIVAKNDYNYFHSSSYSSSYSMSEAYKYAFGMGNGTNDVLIPLIVVLAVVGVILYSRWKKVQITVTNKRVFGVSGGGKRVDLPLDSISAVGTSIFSGLAVTTASGAIRFAMLKNRDELHEAISKLLVERQDKQKAVATTTIKQEIPQSNADELAKFKSLLDQGIISQEEFDEKKKQLLGLR